MWGDYSAAHDSSFKKDTQNHFQDGTQKGKEKKRGVELEARSALRKGTQIGKGIYDTYVWGLTWLQLLFV